MKTVVLIGAAALIASCKPAEAPVDANADANLAAEANAGDANMTAAAAPMLLNETTWEFTQDGQAMVVSIDKAGAYITQTADGKHLDHGTYALTNGKDCFTSAMGEKMTECYTTTPEVAIGASAPSTDDKGVTTEYKRVDYKPLTMPA